MRYTTRKQTQTQNKKLFPRKLFRAIKTEKAAATKLGRLCQHAPQKHPRPQNTVESNKTRGSVLVFWKPSALQPHLARAPRLPGGPASPAAHATKKGKRAPARQETRGKEKPSRLQPAPLSPPSLRSPPRHAGGTGSRSEPNSAQSGPA